MIESWHLANKKSYLPRLLGRHCPIQECVVRPATVLQKVHDFDLEFGTCMAGILPWHSCTVVSHSMQQANRSLAFLCPCTHWHSWHYWTRKHVSYCDAVGETAGLQARWTRGRAHQCWLKYLRQRVLRARAMTRRGRWTFETVVPKRMTMVGAGFCC